MPFYSDGHVLLYNELSLATFFKEHDAVFVAELLNRIDMNDVWDTLGNILTEDDTNGRVFGTSSESKEMASIGTKEADSRSGADSEVHEETTGKNVPRGTDSSVDVVGQVPEA